MSKIIRKNGSNFQRLKPVTHYKSVQSEYLQYFTNKA